MCTSADTLTLNKLIICIIHDLLVIKYHDTYIRKISTHVDRVMVVVAVMC